MSPANDGSDPAGTSVLVTGLVVPGTPTGIIAAVWVNGVPVEGLDAAGDFFTRVMVLPGQNAFHFTTADILGNTASTTLTLTGTQIAPGTLNFSQLSTIASFQPVYFRTSFDLAATQLYADLAIQNTSTFAIYSTLLVGITNISDPSVRVATPDGYAPDGTPYYNFSTLLQNGALLPGAETTGSRTVSFYDPSAIPFTYTLELLGHLNQPPIFTSTPVLTTVGGKTYQYPVAASDPENNTLTYQLAAGPAGMSIQASTGVLMWSPTTSQLGNYLVAVQVNDGHGGSATQQYELSVTGPLPNHPPRFNAVPLLDAFVNTPYVYTATAADPDGVALDLVRDQWTARAAVHQSGQRRAELESTVTHVGNSSVTIEVTDSRGLTDTQTFTIAVHPQTGDHAPYIVAPPITTVVAGQKYAYLASTAIPTTIPSPGRSSALFRMVWVSLRPMVCSPGRPRPQT